MATRAEIRQCCSEGPVETVRLLYVGNDGVTRGHVADAGDIDAVLENGLSIPKSVQSLTALDERLLEGRFGSVGEVTLLPDPDTFHVLPYVENSAVMLCDLVEESSKPWEADPRSTLAEVLRSLRSEGIEPAVAFESEFHLIRETSTGFEPVGDQGVYATNSMRGTDEFVGEVADALEQQGIGFSRYYPEHAPGKHEVVTEHARGISAPDKYLLTRETIREVACSHDLRATFLPAPFDGATNGCHVHISLWDGDENLFFDPDRAGKYPISERARYFIGGLVEHAPALTALAAPSVNSYSRLRPQQEASAYVCWGEDNREAMVRIPSTAPQNQAATARIEYRPADNTANPYLCLLGLLVAGWDGIKSQIDPGPSLDENPGNLSEAARSAENIQRLPRTLNESLSALEADGVLRDALSPALVDSYVEVKQHQWESFTASAGQWKREQLMKVH